MFPDLLRINEVHSSLSWGRDCPRLQREIETVHFRARMGQIQRKQQKKKKKRVAASEMCWSDTAATPYAKSYRI